MSTADEMRTAFWRQHRDADYLVVDSRSKLCLGAIYYAPDWWDTPEVKRQELVDFFAAVKEIEMEERVQS